MRPHQELRGQVAYNADVVPLVTSPGREPARQYAVPYRVRDCGEKLLITCSLLRLSYEVEEVVQYGPSQGFHADCGAIVFDFYGWQLGSLLLHVYLIVGRIPCLRVPARRMAVWH